RVRKIGGCRSRYLVALRLLVLFAGWQLAQFLLPEQPECIQPQVLRRPALLAFPPVVVLPLHPVTRLHQLALAALPYPAPHPLPPPILLPPMPTVRRRLLLSGYL